MSRSRNAVGFGILLGVVAFSGAHAQDAGKQSATNVPKAWAVDLEPDDIDSAIKPAFEGDNGTMPQQGMNQYMGIMASVWDAKLLLTYLKLSDKLNAAARQKLYAEQALWLKRREKQSNAAGAGEAGGSLAPAEYSETFIKVTRDRNAELQKRLDQAGK